MKYRYYLAGIVTYSRHRERLGMWAIADAENGDRIVSHQGTRERAVQWCETMNQPTKRQAKEMRG